MGKRIILQNAEPNEYRCLFIEDECLKYESESYGGQEVEARYWLDQSQTKRLFDRIAQGRDVLSVLKDYFQNQLSAEAFVNLCDDHCISCKREVWWE